MNINPGELNKKIKIIALQGEEDADGFDGEKEQVIIRETNAKITRVSASEIMKSGQEIEVVTCRFLVRYSKKAVERGMYVVYRGQYYRIEYVNNYGDSNEYIEIMTKAGVSDGRI